MDTQEVNRLNNNMKFLQKIQKENKIEKENKIQKDNKIQTENKIQKDITQKKNKSHICSHCNLNFDSYELLERHKWSKHSQDDYQYKWSQIRYEDRSKYSMAYLDDPYY